MQIFDLFMNCKNGLLIRVLGTHISKLNCVFSLFCLGFLVRVCLGFFQYLSFFFVSFFDLACVSISKSDWNQVKRLLNRVFQ